VNTGHQNQSFEQLLSVFLQSRQGGAGVDLGGQHLDEDALSAFVEGTLSEREAVPVITHLVDCGACRGISAQLARLASDFEDVPVAVQNEAKQPGQLAAFWNTLTQKVFNPFDDSVLAYKDDEKEEAKEKDADEENKDDSQK
jgi:hypothetical protein